MCTLTFVPTEDGYLAGMNRDELHTRPVAFPPEVFERNAMKMLYPRELSGGTWIAANSQGNLLALLNWTGNEASYTGEKRKTRGLAIPELIGLQESSTTNSHFHRMDLDGLFPFRLVGIFRSERAINEWRWDGMARRKLEFSWARKHWFSSSLSDSLAEKERGPTCEAAAGEPAAGSDGWLRRLHRSHIAGPGPFSVCVHRQDAATVSYTEVRCGGTQISMDYLDGNPCMKNGFDEFASLTLKDPLVHSNLPKLQI
jgi:transport and Golgi organization protein 2